MFETVRDGSTHATSVHGVLIKDLARAARKRFRPIDRYREDYVVPELLSRGLHVASGTRGFPRRPDYDWTPAGREADALLDRWLTLMGEILAGRTVGDLERALSYSNGAGAALLLIDDVYPELQALSERGSATGSIDTPDFAGLDFGGLGQLGELGHSGGDGGHGGHGGGHH
jgi:hypothetical protein